MPKKENEWRGETDREKRNKWLKRTYKMTIEDLEWLLVKQKGKCGVCSTEVNVFTCVVDHDHIDGHIRGALCTHCNLALGHLKESKTNVRRALYYLTKDEENDAKRSNDKG